MGNNIGDSSLLHLLLWLTRRCMLKLYRPHVQVHESYALIRHPVERIISAWDWAIQIVPQAAEFLQTFDNFLNDRVNGIAAFVFHVPECAFVATK